MPALTVTVDAATALRITAAVGRARGLLDATNQPRSATLAEVQAEVARYLAGLVREMEVAQARAQADGAFVPPVIA